MEVNAKENNNTSPQSQNQILNQSFDQRYQTLVTQPLGFDGQSLQRMNATNLALIIDRDGAGNPIYLGLAAPGSLVSESKWQIRKLTFDGANNVTAIQYADGDSNFDNIWNDRTSGTYV